MTLVGPTKVTPSPPVQGDAERNICLQVAEAGAYETLTPQLSAGAVRQPSTSTASGSADLPAWQLPADVKSAGKAVEEQVSVSTLYYIGQVDMRLLKLFPTMHSVRALYIPWRQNLNVSMAGLASRAGDGSVTQEISQASNSYDGHTIL